MPRLASETTLAEATLYELHAEMRDREWDIVGPDCFWDEDRLPYQVAGDFKPVAALVTKALGPGVWDDMRFIMLWESYCDRKLALDYDTTLPFDGDFEAGLVAGMWAGNSALSTIKGRPWAHGDYDDREITYASALTKLRSQSPSAPTAGDVPRILGVVGSTMSEHHLITACAESRLRLEANGDELVIRREERKDLPAIRCGSDPKTGSLVFRLDEVDPRRPYMASRFTPEDEPAAPATFKVRPSSLIGRFIRTLTIAEVELDRDRDMPRIDPRPIPKKTSRKTAKE